METFDYEHFIEHSGIRSESKWQNRISIYRNKIAQARVKQMYTVETTALSAPTDVLLLVIPWNIIFLLYYYCIIASTVRPAFFSVQQMYDNEAVSTVVLIARCIIWKYYKYTPLTKINLTKPTLTTIEKV